MLIDLSIRCFGLDAPTLVAIGDRKTGQQEINFLNLSPENHMN